MNKQANQNVPKSLRDFKSSLKSCKLFIDAPQELPQFLNTNLVDQARSIKIFRCDALAYIKIFYFQFLKLCFESQDVDYDTKINKFIELLEKNEQMLRLGQKYCYQQITAATIKDILFQFLELLSECKEPVQSSLAKYPAISDIITNFLSDYLTNKYSVPNDSYNSTKSVEILSQVLEVDIVKYDDCIQFTDSQVYSYKDNEDQIYMIYIDESKAIRNTKMDANDELNDSGMRKNSNKSIDPENCEIIAFDAPDIVFNQSLSSKTSQSDIKINLETQLQTAATFRKKTSSVLKQILPNSIESCNTTNKMGKLSELITNQSKQNNQKSYFNVTKQFTNTFILDNIIEEPYRTKIKEIKSKARKQRKSKQPLFL